MKLKISLALLLTALLIYSKTDIIEKNKKFTDGNNMLENITGYRTVADVQAYGFNGTMESVFVFPDKFRVKMELGPIKTEEIFDGYNYWSIDMNGKLLRKYDKKEIDKARLNAMVAAYKYFEAEKYGIDIKHLGEKEEDGKTYEVLEFSYGESNPITYWFNPETGAIVKTQVKEMGMLITETRSGHKNYSGLMIAENSEISMGFGANVISKTTKIELNPKVDKGFFTIKEDKKDFLIRPETGVTKFKFELKNNHIYVKAAINNNKPVDFIYDTGAMATVLDKSYAEKVGLKLEGELPGVGAVGMEAASLAKVDLFTIGEADFFSQSVAVLDFSGIKKMFGNEFHGLIGYDVISRVITLVDYENETMTFTEPQRFKLPEGFEELPSTMYNKFFRVEALINGKKGRFIFDTGSNSYVDVTDDFAEVAGIDTLASTKDHSITGLGGTASSVSAAECDISVIGHESRTRVGIHDANAGVFAISDIDGIIGSGFFKDYAVITDYENQKIYIKRND